jgi:hypothetical protein
MFTGVFLTRTATADDFVGKYPRRLFLSPGTACAFGGAEAAGGGGTFALGPLGDDGAAAGGLAGTFRFGLVADFGEDLAVFLPFVVEAFALGGAGAEAFGVEFLEATGALDEATVGGLAERDDCAVELGRGEVSGDDAPRGVSELTPEPVLLVARESVIVG